MYFSVTFSLMVEINQYIQSYCLSFVSHYLKEKPLFVLLDQIFGEFMRCFKIFYLVLDSVD